MSGRPTDLRDRVKFHLALVRASLQMADEFVAGPTPEEALEAATSMAKQIQLVVVDLAIMEGVLRERGGSRR
jgi:hypothetical protein